MVLVAFSALIYVFSFILSEWFWWGSFIFPFFLFMYANKKPLSFIQGYLWGIIAYGCVLMSVYIALFEMSVGPIVVRLLPSLLVFLYVPLFPACSFYLMQRICSSKLLATTTGLLITIFLVDQYLFFMCARLEGCMLPHPLIPLCQVPQLLWLLPYVGTWIITLLLISVSLFLFLSVQDWRYIFLCIASLISFFGGFFLENRKEVPTWTKTIVSVPKLLAPAKNTQILIDRVGSICRHVITQYPDVELIIFPEGALYCKDLVSNHSCIDEWSHEKLGKKVDIVFGTFHQEDDNMYNSLQWFYDGKFMQMYHKQHALPITEQLPWWLSFSWYIDAYFSDISQITPSDNQRELFLTNKEQKFIPFICSEFFCIDKALKSTNLGVPLIVCNDSWFRFTENNPYFQQLMRLGAQFRAIESQQELLYISFSRAYYIDMYGYIHPVMRFNH